MQEVHMNETVFMCELIGGDVQRCKTTKVQNKLVIE